MPGGKWSARPVLDDAVNLSGLEFIVVGDNPTQTFSGSTVSVDHTDSSFNDSANGLPVIPPGKKFAWLGFADANGEFNATHVVVSSNASKMVVETVFTASEAAGASVTGDAVDESYRVSLQVLADYAGAAGLPNPLAGHTFKDSRHTAVTANVTGTHTANASDGNVHELTLTGNCTIDVNLGSANASYLHLIIIPGAYTATLGTSFHKWLGDAPSAIAAENHVIITSRDGGTTNVARDLGGAA